MQITKITIGRLFNIGNYEHIRYELSAEIQHGESAESALIGLEKVVSALNPKRSCKTWDEIKRAERDLCEMRGFTDEEFSRRYGYAFKGAREEYENRIAAGIVEAKFETDKWETRHAKARKYLDAVGGAAKWKDAKLDWENNDQFNDNL